MSQIYNSNRKYIDIFSNIKQKTVFCLFFSLFFNLLGHSVTREEVYNYIDKYKDAALIEQRDNGIPVSITLAQGLLESAAGTSRLAREGNNHFGVKCHRSYKGDSVIIGKTCYRKYRSVHDSYLDHSRFLKGKRYQELFTLPLTDYRGWAHGLKRCGYATDSLYAEKLISMIETYGLDQLVGETAPAGDVAKVDKTKPKPKPHKPTKQDMQEQHWHHPKLHHPIKRRNDLNYVMAVLGDTYQDIAKECNVKPSKLLEYNDIANDKEQPEVGEIVYINKKHSEAQGAVEQHQVQDSNETLWLISQLYGIRLKDLAKLNKLAPDATLHKGDIIRLKR